MPDSFPRQYARTQRFTLGSPRDFTITEAGATVLFLRSSGPEDSVNSLWGMDTETGNERLIADPREMAAETQGDLPSAEQPRRERARERAGGITAYSTDRSGSLAAFALGGELFVVDTSSGSFAVFETSGGAFYRRLSGDGQLVSFVANAGLYLASTDGAVVAQPIATEDSDTVSWGSAEFVAAEDMRRSRGHWWDPTSNETSSTTEGDGDEDELYSQAVDIIKSEGKASTSFLQRKLQIGYNRAARIIDMMEEKGIVSKANHVGKREVL